MTFVEAVKELRTISMSWTDCEIRLIFKPNKILDIEISFDDYDPYNDYFLISVKIDNRDNVIMNFDTDTACKEMFSEKLQIASKVCKLIEENPKAFLELLK